MLRGRKILMLSLIHICLGGHSPREGFLKGPPLVAKAAPPVPKIERYLNTDNVVTKDSEDDDIYTDVNASLRKSINDFLVASVEKQQKICILENQNRKQNLKNKKMDERNKEWSSFKKAFKKAPGTQTSEKNSEDKKRCV